MSMEFNYFHCVNITLDVIEDVLSSIDGKSHQWWDEHIFYSGNSVNIPGYPYMAYNIPSPHSMEQRSPTYEHEVFSLTMNCNFYDIKSPEFPIIAIDDLHVLLKDPIYTRIFHRNGFVVSAVSSNGATNSDIANANDIYSQNLQIKLRFGVHHRSRIENINNTNLVKRHRRF